MSASPGPNLTRMRYARSSIRGSIIQVCEVRWAITMMMVMMILGDDDDDDDEDDDGDITTKPD